MLTVRVNTLKANRIELLKEFADMGYDVRPTKFAQNGIRFVRHPEGNLFRTVQFKKGHFEV